MLPRSLKLFQSSLGWSFVLAGNGGVALAYEVNADVVLGEKFWAQGIGFPYVVGLVP